jgi:glutaredoxin 3
LQTDQSVSFRSFLRDGTITGRSFEIPKGKEMHVTIYTRENCPNCVTAKRILEAANISYTDVDIELGDRLANFLKEFPDARQMPQIFINDQRVGGLAGLQAALKQLGI